MCHLVPKPQHHKDDKVLKESKENEDNADEDPLNERTDLAGGRNFLRCAVVQVDRHQKQSEKQSKSDDTKINIVNTVTNNHLPGTASTLTAKLIQLTITIKPEGRK